MKKQIFKSFLILALLISPFAAAKAANLKTDNSIYIGKEEIVGGNLYAVGNTITIDGNINGDLIAAAQTITVNGRVEGDIIAAVAQEITVNGEVGGNIRIAGNSLTMNGPVARNVNALGTKIFLGDQAHVGWDAYLAATNIEVRGSIDGNLNGRVGRALIAGKIGKDVDLNLSDESNSQTLIIAPGAIINGDLSYTAKNTANISDKASISGKTQQKPLEIKTTNWFMIWLWGRLFAIFSALAVGLILVFLGKNITPRILNKIQEAPWKIFWPGLIIMLILPPIALILIFTLIGIPLAFMILATWLILIYLAKIITAILIGQLILNKITKTDNWKPIWPLILGVLISWLVFSIPVIGWLTGLLAITFGLGGIWAFFSPFLKNLEPQL